MNGLPRVEALQLSALLRFVKFMFFFCKERVAVFFAALAGLNGRLFGIKFHCTAADGKCAVWKPAAFIEIAFFVHG